MSKLAEELSAILDCGSDERVVHAWLKKHPDLMISTFWGASNMKVCIPEFRLADQWRADFLLVYAFSGGYEIKLIELEPPTAELYNKDGSESKRLRSARTQIQNWQRFIDEHNQFFRECVSKALEPYDEYDWSFTDDSRKAHRAIKRSDVYAKYYYQVVIGRRAMLSGTELGRKGRSDFGIATYDRLLDRARQWDLAAKGKSEDPSVWWEEQMGGRV